MSSTVSFLPHTVPIYWCGLTVFDNNKSFESMFGEFLYILAKRVLSGDIVKEERPLPHTNTDLRTNRQTDRRTASVPA
ncbi:hypothetical protein PAMP_018467 [Pampus punctatissimus]